jgi:hypothetical protein
MNYTYFTTTEDDLVANANTVKEMVLEQLEIDGVIESAEKLALSYIIVAQKKGMFGKAWDKVWGIDKKPKDTTSLVMLKVENV